MTRFVMIFRVFTVVTFIFFLVPHSFSQNVTAPVTPDKACNITTNPDFCRSVLPPYGRSDLYDYGRFLVRQSLHQSKRFSHLIDRSLRDNSTSLSGAGIGALRDCIVLSQLTTNYLSSSIATLNDTTTTTLPVDQADDVHTLLSAIVTNQQTCFDGLAQASVLKRKGDLYQPLVNGSKLYSTSLAMFTHSWAQKGHKKHKQGRQLLDELRVRRDGLPSWVNGGFFRSGPSRRSVQQSVRGGAPVLTTVVVAKRGKANFSSINDAIAAAPDNVNASYGYYVIKIKEGVYEEYVSVNSSKSNIMMVGAGINKTIITGNRSVGDGFTTFNSATFVVVGRNFVGMRLTIRNTAGPAKHQAVAVRNGADLSTFYKCSFEGYQDTLYAHSLRQFYRECDVYGTVDFIFGNAAVVFQKCKLYARLPSQGQSNMFTAQGRTDPNQNTGISIINSALLTTPELAAANGSIQSYLGRPWKEYSRTVYMLSNIGSLIDPAGWAPWSGDFALSTLYYGEYKNRGAGSKTDKRVTWPGFHVLAAVDASNFTVANFVQGDTWLDSTSVPFSTGLI
ncbi:pectinesterase-like [Nymphaea colorata]|nr:pectinesterase-like [Nymphaea colorata]